MTGFETVTANDAEARLERLRGYLSHDPDNLSLATDCADAALAAGWVELATAILTPFADTGTLDPAASNVFGIAAMRSGDYETAEARFTQVLDGAPDDAGVRFNLAWTQALAGRHADAREALGEITATDLPQAAMLDLQIDHHLGELDVAADKMREYLERFPDYAPLQAAASVLAMDLEDIDLARACAERAGAHPDALATLGALELGDNRLADARDLFARALETRDANPRAHVGLGLVALAGGDAAAALPHLDRGAAQFGDHLGSWIAAGWAHFLAGDAATAQARFETALAADDTFGEAHGSLAAMHAFAGDFDAARREQEIALRLDRQSFSAALTGVVLAAADGDQAQAGRIMELALRQPIGVDGGTLADALARMAL